MRAFVREQLVGNAPAQRFLSGGVSVCGLVPLRNVPFKLICVLGLDADAFPRRDPADAMNRMLAGRRLPGDRSVREDDRYLFLQTLMAAQEQLYLSYTGIDMRKGTPIEPSVVLSELLDHVCEGYFTDAKAARGALVTRHPMQAFSARLFAAGEAAREAPNVFTYRGEWLDAARPGPRDAAPAAFADVVWPQREEVQAIELAELRRFLRNPAESFLRGQAGIALAAEADPLDEREPLTLGPLQHYQLDAALAAGVDAGTGRDRLADLQARALLPPLAWGQAAYRETMEALGPGLRQWQAWRRAHPPRPAQRFRLDLGQGRVLAGMLDGLHEGGFGAWVGSAHSPGGWMQWWLGALVARALEQAPDARAWGRDSDKAPWRLPWRPAMPDAAQSRSLLADYVDLYRDGQRDVLPIPLRTAFAWAGKRVGDDAADVALKVAQQAWDGGFNSYAESTDAWFALALRGRALFDEGELQQRFEMLASRVHLPLCRALKEGGSP